jgi:hypothetical protein
MKCRDISLDKYSRTDARTIISLNVVSSYAAVYDLGCFAVGADNFQRPQTIVSDLDPKHYWHGGEPVAQKKKSRSCDSTGRLHHFFLQTFNPETPIIWPMAGSPSCNDYFSRDHGQD